LQLTCTFRTRLRRNGDSVLAAELASLYRAPLTLVHSLENDMTLYRRALLLLPLTALAIAACASGSAIVTGNRRPPVAPEQVTLYLESPAEFEVIGLVNASSDAGWTQQGSLDYAIRELKKQAAMLGANGVLIVATGETTSTMILGQGTGSAHSVPVSGKTVQGKAIFVKKP
jgi:hypothetical protein